MPSESEASHQSEGGNTEVPRGPQSQRLSHLQEVGQTVQTIVGGKGAKHGHQKDQLIYDPEWHFVRIGFALLSESLPYKLAMACSILINMGILIIETDLRAHRRTQHWEIYTETDSFVFTPPNWIQTAGLTLLAFYVVDLIIRLYVLRGKFFSSTANKFDFAIVSTDCMVLVLEPLQDLPSVAVLRVLRMLRIVRVLRSFLAFRELYLMMQGLVSAIRSIVFATFLIAVVLVLWSIMAVEFVHMNNVQLSDAGFYGDCSEIFCRNAFASVWLSSLTFLKGIIAGDSWGTLAYPLIIERPWTSFVLLGSLLMVQLGLLNLIVAVIVDRAAAARENDEELMYTEKQETLDASYKRLQGLFSRMDEDGGGTLSLEEMQESYNTHAEFREILDLMDIRDRDLELVFKILDTNRDDEVSYSEFVEQLHEMKTFNSHTLLVYIKHYSERTHDLLMSLQKQVDGHDVNVEELKTAVNEVHPSFQFTAASGSDLQDVPSASQPITDFSADELHTRRMDDRRGPGDISAFLAKKQPEDMDAPAEPAGCAVEASTLAEPSLVAAAKKIGLQDVKVPYVRPSSFSEKVRVAQDVGQAQWWDLEQELLAHADALESSIRLGLERCIKAAVFPFIEATVNRTSVALDRHKSEMDYNNHRWRAVATVLEDDTRPPTPKPQLPVLLARDGAGEERRSPRPDLQEVVYDTNHVHLRVEDDSYADNEEASFLNDYRFEGHRHDDHDDEQSIIGKPQKPQKWHRSERARTPPNWGSSSQLQSPLDAAVLQANAQAGGAAAAGGTGAAAIPPPAPVTLRSAPVSHEHGCLQEDFNRHERPPQEDLIESGIQTFPEVLPMAPSCAVGLSFSHIQDDNRPMPRSGPLCPNGNPTTRVADTKSQHSDWVEPPPDD